MVIGVEVLAQPELQSSRFERTVLAVQVGSEQQRTSFTATALTQLIETYIAESDLARKQAQNSSEQRKLLDWSRAVDAYATQLLLVLEDVALDIPVKIRFTNDQVVAVVVGGRTVILSHPRTSQQSAFEQRVLTEFCAANSCESLTEANKQLEPIPLGAFSVSPDWAFRGTAATCTYGELSVSFSSLNALSVKKRTCAQFMQEVSMLAAELAWQQRHGVVINWKGLSVQPTPQRPEHLLTLNDAGDSLLLTIPLIYRAPQVLLALEPWLKSRYQESEPGMPVEFEAHTLGWE